MIPSGPTLPPKVNLLASGSQFPPPHYAIFYVTRLAGETAALNLPGTDTERPNWRRKVGVRVDTLWNTPSARQAIADFAGTRARR